ncbi:MAG: hypothetical protein AB9828_04050 [Sphaerochaetaceae bacterium]
MARYTVGLIYGGKSVEHDISIRSATSLYRQLTASGHNVVPLGITLEGIWYLQEPAHGSDWEVLPMVADNAHLLDVCPGRGIFVQASHKKLPIDVCFPITHGTNGEDGRLQGLLELLDIPYVGCDPLSSAIGMQKSLAKHIASAFQIPVVPAVVMDTDDIAYLAGTVPEASLRMRGMLAIETPAQGFPIAQNNPLEGFLQYLLKNLGKDILLKPDNGGSSVGVTVLRNPTSHELLAALESVGRYCQTILIEQLVTGMVEIECAVLERNGTRLISQPGVVIDPAHDVEGFLSYRQKYEAAQCAYMEIPAPVPPHVAAKLHTFSETLAQAFGVHGFARIDFFYMPKTGQIYFNETNTLPGMTGTSHYPRLVATLGYDWPGFLQILLDDALLEYGKRKRIIYGET